MTATDTARCESSLFPVLLEHAAQYSDLDPSRRIGRDTLVRWFEDARVQLGREALDADLEDRAHGLVRLRLVAVRVDVLAPLRIAGDYRIGIGVSRIGSSSVSYRYGVFAGDECVATGESTSVYVGDGGGPAPLPDELREQLGRHRIAGPEAPTPERDQVRAREAYPFRLDVRTRFGDLDTNRHVNNVRAGHLVPRRARRAAPRRARLPDRRPARRARAQHAAVQYLGEVHYPGIYQLRVGVLGIDDDIVRYACGLFDGPTCVGLAEAGARATRRTRTASRSTWRRRWSRSGCAAELPHVAKAAFDALNAANAAFAASGSGQLTPAPRICSSAAPWSPARRPRTGPAGPACGSRPRRVQRGRPDAVVRGDPDDVHGVHTAAGAASCAGPPRPARPPRTRSRPRRGRPCRTPPRSRATSRSGWNDAPGCPRGSARGQVST